MRSHRCWNWRMRSRCCWRRCRAAAGPGTSIRTCNLWDLSTSEGWGLCRSRKSLEFMVEVLARVLEKDAPRVWGCLDEGCPPFCYSMHPAGIIEWTWFERRVDDMWTTGSRLPVTSG